MPRYVLLVDWTEHGVEAVEQTADRLDHGSEIAENFGCEIEHVWWTQGSHDMVSVVHAPDEESMVAYTLAVVRLGNFQRRRCVRGAKTRCATSSAVSDT